MIAFLQCSMCRTAVAQSPGVANTLDSAILILLVPAVAMFCGVYFMAFRGNRN